VLALTAVAGGLVSLYVTLVTSSGESVANHSDPQLSVTCESYYVAATGALETPAAGSWCGPGPTISPQGDVYLVSIRPRFFP
jgi:hypothetical protein